MANLGDFNAIRYKKHYNNKPQVLVIRQTVNSMEGDNLSAMYIFRRVSAGTINFFEIFSA